MHWNEAMLSFQAGCKDNRSTVCMLPAVSDLLNIHLSHSALQPQAPGTSTLQPRQHCSWLWRRIRNLSAWSGNAQNSQSSASQKSRLWWPLWRHLLYGRRMRQCYKQWGCDQRSFLHISYPAAWQWRPVRNHWHFCPIWFPSQRIGWRRKQAIYTGSSMLQSKQTKVQFHNRMHLFLSGYISSVLVQPVCARFLRKRSYGWWFDCCRR